MVATLRHLQLHGANAVQIEERLKEEVQKMMECMQEFGELMQNNMDARARQLLQATLQISIIQPINTRQVRFHALLLFSRPTQWTVRFLRAHEFQSKLSSQVKAFHERQTAFVQLQNTSTLVEIRHDMRIIMERLPPLGAELDGPAARAVIEKYKGVENVKQVSEQTVQV